jgi:adenine-specific DNA-methyltransferase
MHPANPFASQREIISAAMRLGAATIAGWSQREALLAGTLANDCAADRIARPPMGSVTSIEELRAQIREGEDPLGCAFISLRAAPVRRALGATYTPFPIVRSMLTWAYEHGAPERIVDPGVGSGRFLLCAAQLFPEAHLIGVEIDPVAALVARANLAAAGLAHRALVILSDYREVDLRSDEPTLFVGNPPYVRHHLIAPRWKEWLATGWKALGITASRLAGLHIHFFLATLLNARPGDYGAFVTAAEWLDVNYGSSLRNGFLGNLGGEEIIVVEPTAAAFPGAATTAALTFFRVGSHPAFIRVRRVTHPSQVQPCDSKTSAGSMSASQSSCELISRARLETESRWSRLTRPALRHPPGFIELGELCRVHRGQATGANNVWILTAPAAASHRLPARVLFPTVTRAREIICAGPVLSHSAHLRVVVDLPEDLDQLDFESRAAVEVFLRDARRLRAHETYVARHRPAWWSVGLRPAAPILATYMARHAPVFTLNAAGARHLNIAHGLYPREHLNEQQLLALVEYLSREVSVADGRTYAGGLTKFEPREMERIRVPRPRAPDAQGGPRTT